MKILSVLALCAASLGTLAGCVRTYEPPPQMDSAEEEKYRADLYACHDLASKLPPQYRTSGPDRANLATEVDRCMEARGYAVNPAELAPPPSYDVKMR